MAPASLLANWAAEIARFAPDLRTLIAHPSAMPSDEIKALDAAALADVDLVITSYGTLQRTPSLARHAVAAGHSRRGADHQESRRPSRPGPSSSSTRVAHRADRHADREPARRPLVDLRLPQSGTARLGQAVRRLHQAARRSAGRGRPIAADKARNPYAPLRELVRPYILRRLKTDKSIIADLPDKTEVKTFCPLSRAAGRALPAGRRGARRPAREGRRHAAPRPRAGVPDALEADLQSSLAVARRRRLERGRQRQARAPARDRRGDRGAPGEGAGLHPVQGDDGAAGRVPGPDVRAGRASC